MKEATGVAVKVLFFDQDSSYKGISFIIIKIHISISEFYFSIKRLKEEVNSIL